MDPIGLTNLGPSPGAAPFQPTQGLGANPTGGGHLDFVFVIVFVSVTVTVLFRVPPNKRPHHDSRPPNVGQHRALVQRQEQSNNTYNATSPNP